jgi:hypothetical protein
VCNTLPKAIRTGKRDAARLSQFGLRHPLSGFWVGHALGHTTNRRILRVYSPASMRDVYARADTPSTAGFRLKMARNRLTIYLTKGGDLEKAKPLAAHESPRTTKLY